ncbi:MAG: TMEM43 family protein [Synergistaceae bacterium]|nr:TMEM43 family protein [Synergistaceae bacterium]
MAHTETSYRGWGDRLGGAFKGIVTGIVIIGLGTWLLWWNEGRTFRRAGVIGEAQMLARDVQDIGTLDPSLDGQVIHATGRADTQDVLRDPIFGASATAIRIGRDVEWYQWVEHARTEKRKKLGGGEETVTVYDYKKEWTSRPVDSSGFHDPDYNGTTKLASDVGPNDVLATFEDDDVWAANVTFGAYRLSDAQKRSIGGRIPLTLDPSSEDIFAISQHVRPTNLYRSRYMMWKDVQIEDLIHVSGSTVYIGLAPSQPRIGDVRVSFTQTPPADVSIVAKVVRDTFEPYTSPNGNGSFSRLSMGTVGMEKMFEDARSENSFFAWALRAAGLIVVILGLRMVFAPLVVLADVVPILGNIVGAGVGIVTFLLGLAWSLIVVAVAWLRWRPLLAGGMIAVAVALIFLPTLLRKKGGAA